MTIAELAEALGTHAKRDLDGHWIVCGQNWNIHIDSLGALIYVDCGDIKGCRRTARLVKRLRGRVTQRGDFELVGLIPNFHRKLIGIKRLLGIPVDNPQTQAA